MPHMYYAKMNNLKINTHIAVKYYLPKDILTTLEE